MPSARKGSPLRIDAVEQGDEALVDHFGQRFGPVLPSTRAFADQRQIFRNWRIGSDAQGRGAGPPRRAPARTGRASRPLRRAPPFGQHREVVSLPWLISPRIAASPSRIGVKL